MTENDGRYCKMPGFLNTIMIYALAEMPRRISAKTVYRVNKHFMDC